MKFFAYLGTLIIFFGSFYAIGHFGIGYVSNHPSLNTSAAQPDLYLHNAKHYTKEFGTDRSLYHLEKAIESIKTIETDIDLNTTQKVDYALVKLETIYEEILRDSLVSDDMNKAFEYTLNTLTLAELRVSERYAESNQTELAMIALKYARLHLKNALKYADLRSMKFEQHLYYELDSILKNQKQPSVLITEKLDQLITEIEAKL